MPHPHHALWSHICSFLESQETAQKPRDTRDGLSPPLVEIYHRGEAVTESTCSRALCCLRFTKGREDSA